MGDFGFRVAVRKLYKLRKDPTVDGYIKRSKPWRPYRSIATWYLWKSLDPKFR